MSFRYEIWEKSSWGKGNSSPKDTSSTLDMAMDLSKSLSKKGDKFFVLDKNQSPSVIRGFGINGKWHDAIANCKRCSNSGDDYSGNFNWSQDNTCTTCQGASWKPY